MIHVKRLTQPPAITWVLWDSALPDLVIHTALPADVWAAVQHDPEKLRQAVLAHLLEAGERVLAFNRELEEL